MVLPRKSQAIGYDFGLKTFLTGSDGSLIISPRFLETNAARLRKTQQTLFRKQKSSNNRARARLAVTQAHRHKKPTVGLVLQDRPADPRGLCGCVRRGSGPGRHPAALGTQGIRLCLCRVPADSGVPDGADRFFPSSKTCARCGYVKPELPLSVREWECPSFHRHFDRDINAAQNILLEGLRTA